jgi:hypothetical protein
MDKDEVLAHLMAPMNNGGHGMEKTAPEIVNRHTDRLMVVHDNDHRDSVSGLGIALFHFHKED